jgi:UDPglucose--hexose-1-phosphate uridylyltransferase
MELRKDPVTQSWMLVGDEEDAFLKESSGPCQWCAGGQLSSRPIYTSAGGVRVYAHPHPLFRIEGLESHAAEGLYDRMRTVGAHEVVLESATHERQIWLATDREAAEVLNVFAARIVDLKKDQRFRYVTVFKNSGKLAGEEFSHAHSQITATPFVPRRMVYELRASRAHFQAKERCVFCDIVQQEESLGIRVVEATRNYLAICPFAARVPYELWIAPRYHAASYEQDVLSRSGDVQELAGLLRRSLARVRHVADDFHMVLHTTPNSSTQRGVSVQWTTLADDYHWHIEILPIAERRTRSYSIKEVYYSPVSPERAAEELRRV